MNRINFHRDDAIWTASKRQEVFVRQNLFQGTTLKKGKAPAFYTLKTTPPSPCSMEKQWSSCSIKSITSNYPGCKVTPSVTKQVEQRIGSSKKMQWQWLTVPWTTIGSAIKIKKAERIKQIRDDKDNTILQTWALHWPKKERVGEGSFKLNDIEHQTFEIFLSQPLLTPIKTKEQQEDESSVGWWV